MSNRDWWPNHLRLDLLRQLHEIRFFEPAVQRLCEQAWSGSRRGERDGQVLRPRWLA